MILDGIFWCLFNFCIKMKNIKQAEDILAVIDNEHASACFL